MTIKRTEGTKGQGRTNAPVGVVAGDVGLDHEAGDHALHSVKRTMGRLFGRVHRASRKKS